jgi:hypothetical protein
VLPSVAVLKNSPRSLTVSPAANVEGITPMSRGGGVATARKRAMAEGWSGRKASTTEVWSAVPSLRPTLAVPSNVATATVSVSVVPVSAPRATRKCTMAPGTGACFASVAVARSGSARRPPAGPDWSLPSLIASATARGGCVGVSWLPHAARSSASITSTVPPGSLGKNILTGCRTIT